MPPDRQYVENLLAEVENTLRFLRELGRTPRDEFVQDLRSRYSAAFALLTTIEGVANVAAHLIATESLPTPRGMPDSFEVLHRAGVLRSRELARRLAGMARLRNLLVHRYWTIEYGEVHDVLTGSLSDLGEFADEVLRHLDESTSP